MRLLIILAIGIFFTSCYEDKSKFDTLDVKEVVIDTTGIPPRFVCFFNQMFTLEPKVYKKDTPNPNLEYLWRINIAESDTTRAILGRELKLNTKIMVPPSTRDYKLNLTVYDKSTGLEYTMIWSIFVSSEFGEGLIIAHTKNESSSDLNLIMANEFTSGFQNKGDVTIFRDIYSKNNGSDIAGVINGVYYGNVYNKRRITTITPNSIVRIKPLDYTFMDRDDDAFYVPMGKISPSYICNGATAEYLVFNGRISILSAQNSTRYGYPMAGDYQINKYVAVNPSTYYYSAGGGVVYDEKNGRFLLLPYFYIDSPLIEFKPYVSGKFDPHEVKNKTCLFADLGDTRDYCFVLKERDAEEYYIYVIDGNTGGNDTGSLGKQKYNISALPEIGKAITFVFSPIENTMYYATETHIYAVMLNTENLLTEVRYTVLAPDEKITTLELYKGYGYATIGDKVNEDGNTIPDALGSTYRLLLMSTYNGTEGSLYTLPIKNLGSGIIALDKVQRFGGFGRILATYPQGE